ncbi:peptidylprolyl isomerase [Sphingomonas sp.]|uniref:peptidylprolyl isomerase n=1 Tax=Sphingomonas sp. TaxID=28214 RepID=UPI002DF39697|nr:peptidylprolyl isomerase [Sphingomonas sp.]HEV2569433.1 peptidylprolyl isomerase [Sphingomonas sp.]
MLTTLLLLQAAAHSPAVTPKSPGEIVAAAPDAAWRDISPLDLLVLELVNGARVTMRLAPDWAPVHVANIRALAKARWWDGTSVNRVQDNYVVQWGDATEKKPLPQGVVAPPPAEYWRGLGSVWMRALPYRDAYATKVGHSGGWPVASDGKSAWLVHCYGMLGVGRGLAPDTGSGAELYTVTGHAPRHLDRNIATVGRVLEGIEALTSLPRGTGNLGFYEKAEQRVPIRSIRLGTEVTDVPRWQYLDETSAAFAAYADARANRRDAFFNIPAGGVDICNVPVPVRRKP